MASTGSVSPGAPEEPCGSRPPQPPDAGAGSGVCVPSLLGNATTGSCRMRVLRPMWWLRWTLDVLLSRRVCGGPGSLRVSRRLPVPCGGGSRVNLQIGRVMRGPWLSAQGKGQISANPSPSGKTAPGTCPAANTQSAVGQPGPSGAAFLLQSF